MARSRTYTGNRLGTYNRALSVLNILVAVYIFVTPLLPGWLFAFRKRFQNEPPVYSGQLSQDIGRKTDKKPRGNRLVIPSILLDEPIHEGTTTATLNKGVWRRPNTSTPNTTNNTVLAGHLFTYRSPAVFYNLHKVAVGEKLAVYWEGSEYLYQVADKREVPASAGYVEAPTSDARLTLYTCTPIWNPKNRLIVTAALEKVTPL